MKLYFCPSFNSTTYIDYAQHDGMLWNEAVVGANALLEQLLLRTGLTQTPAEDLDERLKLRMDLYAELLTDDWVMNSLNVDRDGTVTKILEWRDALIMEGWTPKKPEDWQSEKLRSLSRWEQSYNSSKCPGRADLWRLLLDTLSSKDSVAPNLDVEVCVPKGLLPQLIVKVLEKVKGDVTYRTFADTELKSEKRSLFSVREQYESWQQAALQKTDPKTMVVCKDEDRMNNTLKGLRGENYGTDRTGCIHPTDDITNQLDAPQKIVWFDCVGSRGGNYPFKFLSLSEIEELNTKGLSIPSAEEYAQVQQQWLVSSLNRANEVEIWVPRYHESELQAEHPVVTELKNKGVKPSTPQTLQRTPKEKVITFTPVEKLTLDKTYIADLPHGNDSASSLEKLYQRPFDFFVEKMAGLKAPEDDSDEKMAILKGNVAHYVVELLVNNNKTKNLKAIKNELNKNFDGLFDEALKEKGGLLNDSENKNEKVLFKVELEESVNTLLNIIEDLNLTPQCCEYEFTREKVGAFTNAHGYIDLLLRNEKDEYVVVDLKYSKSKTYKEKLSQNQSLQLTYYKHVLESEGKKVAWCGYYQFPLQTLSVSSNSGLTAVDHVEIVDVTGAPTEDDFWKDLEETYKARMSELNQGVLKEGEGFPVSADPSDRFVAVEEKTKVKKTAFSKYPSEEEPRKKPTTHTILKNHLQ